MRGIYYASYWIGVGDSNHDKYKALEKTISSEWIRPGVSIPLGAYALGKSVDLPENSFQHVNFMIGTNAIAEEISKNTIKKSLISILGGGDTLSAIKKCKSKLSFTHLSTAGGAFLEYIEGKDLPGLSVLK